jgi:hypothetical protein
MKQLTYEELRRLAGLSEADTREKDKTSLGLDWDTMFDEPKNHKVATTGTKPDTVPAMPTASKAQTSAATARINPTDQMRDMLGKLDRTQFPDSGQDQAAEVPEQEPVTPQTLPALISKHIATTGGTVTPDWHAVANLPGNADRVINMLGKQLFGAFTRTPTQQINMIGNLGGQGPNTEEEVRSVANWVVQHGRPVDTATLDFDKIMPGYKAEIQMYSAGGVRFELVRDAFGDYIYAWPEGDSVDTQQQVDQDATKKLR